MPTDGDPAARLAALARDDEHGAAEIASAARQALAALAQDPQAADRAREAALALVQAHPSMAPVLHLADETLRYLDERGPAGLTRLPRETPQARRVARQAAPAIADADLVATYSRSGTVLAAVEAALARGPLTVLVSEARPGGEGLPTARALAEAGADVRLNSDANLLARAGEADLVLVGADAITPEVFVNKTGTRPLLAQARRAGTPTQLLAGTDKLWPAQLGPPPVDEQADGTPDVPDPIDVEAPLFERVPLALVDRVVTEEGAHEADRLADRVGRRELHPALHAAL
jgi:translation initiation factor 2B subunit (eIF-2B alpha/beta/delta family)